jgi:hypothetical protein
MGAFEYKQAEEIRDVFKCRGVRYLFIGKSGAILLGYPDTTQDADLFVETSETNGRALVEALKDLQFDLNESECAEIRRGKCQLRPGSAGVTRAGSPCRISVFTRRARRATARHPKFFLFDAGVFRSLRPRGPLDSPGDIEGAALEGLVVQHLRAWNAYRGARPRRHACTEREPAGPRRSPPAWPGLRRIRWGQREIIPHPEGKGSWAGTVKKRRKTLASTKRRFIDPGLSCGLPRPASSCAVPRLRAGPCRGIPEGGAVSATTWFGQSNASRISKPLFPRPARGPSLLAPLAA